MRLAHLVLIALVGVFFTSATDNFAYTTTDIATSGNWTCSESNGVGADGSSAYEQTGVNRLKVCYWSHDSFSNNQTSQVTLHNDNVGTFREFGTAVRITGSSVSNMTGYLLDFDNFSGTWTIYRLDSGATFTSIATGSASLVANDVIKLGISSSTLTAYKNGSSLGTGTDSTYTSGSAGIMFHTFGGPTGKGDELDAFIGDPISGGGGATFPAGIISSAPIHCCR
jgi:hypothetical protein